MSEERDLDQALELLAQHMRNGQVAEPVAIAWRRERSGYVVVHQWEPGKRGQEISPVFASAEGLAGWLKSNVPRFYGAAS